MSEKFTTPAYYVGTLLSTARRHFTRLQIEGLAHRKCFKCGERLVAVLKIARNFEAAAAKIGRKHHFVCETCLPPAIPDEPTTELTLVCNETRAMIEKNKANNN